MLGGLNRVVSRFKNVPLARVELAFDSLDYPVCAISTHVTFQRLDEKIGPVVACGVSVAGNPIH